MMSKSAAYDESRDPLTRSGNKEEMFRQAQHDERVAHATRK